MGHTSAVHGAMSPCWHQPSRIPSNVSLDTLNVSFKNFFVFELQWILLVFAFWHRQKTGFEASERNKDASHAPTARKLILDAVHATRVAAFLARASPNRFFKNKTERGGEEREKRKRRKGRERRKGEEAPANSIPEWPECSACI